MLTSSGSKTGDSIKRWRGRLIIYAVSDKIGIRHGGSLRLNVECLGTKMSSGKISEENAKGEPADERKL